MHNVLATHHSGINSSEVKSMPGRGPRTKFQSYSEALISTLTEDEAALIYGHPSYYIPEQYRSKMSFFFPRIQLPDEDTPDQSFRLAQPSTPPKYIKKYFYKR